MAFEAVPRHLFLPDIPLDKVYADEAVPVKRDAQGMVISSSSQPSMMALMLNQLQLELGHNVLEIGAGTGYNAAIMQYIVGESGNVTSVEIDTVLAKQASDNLMRAGARASQVKVVTSDGAMGYAPRASYDRIISTVCIWDVPPAWIQQLKPHGILVTPLWLGGLQVSAAFTRMTDGTLYSEVNLPCGFVDMQGAAAGAPTQKRINSSSLTLLTDNPDRIDSAALHLLLSDDYQKQHLGFLLTAKDYWYGLLPYLMLHEPQGFIFVLYGLTDNQQAYGLEGYGFAFLTQGSAAFVPYHGEGQVHSYGSADAFLALHETIAAWDAAGRPNADQLRLRLVPLDRGEPSVQDGRLYQRRDHYLHVWLSAKAL
jgi:protein-L-isoaspartate(D-aspartate) O-methyltransferase